MIRLDWMISFQWKGFCVSIHGNAFLHSICWKVLGFMPCFYGGGIALYACLEMYEMFMIKIVNKQKFMIVKWENLYCWQFDWVYGKLVMYSEFFKNLQNLLQYKCDIL